MSGVSGVSMSTATRPGGHWTEPRPSVDERGTEPRSRIRGARDGVTTFLTTTAAHVGLGVDIEAGHVAGVNFQESGPNPSKPPISRRSARKCPHRMPAEALEGVGVVC